jgi:hypothetical protein
MEAQEPVAPLSARTVRLGDLTPDQRRLVLALVDAAKEKAPAVSETSAEAYAEVRRGSDERSAA